MGLPLKVFACFLLPCWNWRSFNPFFLRLGPVVCGHAMVARMLSITLMPLAEKNIAFVGASAAVMLIKHSTMPREITKI